MTHAQETNPCVGCMIIDECTGYCTGCFRSESEIGSWDSFTDITRNSILSVLGVRRRDNG